MRTNTRTLFPLQTVPANSVFYHLLQVAQGERALSPTCMWNLVLIYILCGGSGHGMRTWARQAASWCIEGIKAGGDGVYYPNSKKEWVKRTTRCSWHPSMHLTAIATGIHAGSHWVVHEAPENVTSSVTPGVQYQGSWAGKAWQGTITRNPVCMQKKGEPPWKCRF